MYTLNYKGTPLRHKLNLHLNFMFSNLKNVLDKNFSDTSDFGDYIVEHDIMDGSANGMGKLKIIQSNIM